ncbi:XdhC family protein [Antarcticimicrobium luteum]|uniref:XdhC family protein n=1 Tax=Antarcticimicrobium luteum TaxID=2547397 RepID=A0A4R5UQ07_9RHOB|nr:XdhC family protein [Antarcticimicrobium luteum]TDK41120.1 XdhC family protein [Antarcticimicrobium luteum]
MGPFDIFDTIDRQRRAGRPFCVATVVRTADVTSAKAGAKAVVTETGEILGHLGGACVKRAVLSAGQEAIGSGETRLIRVKPSEKVVSLTDADGTQVFKSGCPSGGTVDVLIEPYELPPLLVIFGDTPISRALAAHAALAGYRLALPEGAVGPPEAARFAGTDISALPLDPRDFIVVASQGTQDLACLRAALESPAARVSMIASRRKADALTAKLAAAGIGADRIAGLKSPAGLDIRALDPQEIALSVLAEIVLWRNTDRTTKGDAHENHA